MKIGASSLAGIEYPLENTLEFIENLGIEYAELVHQFPSENIDVDVLESYKELWFGILINSSFILFFLRSIKLWTYRLF